MAPVSGTCLGDLLLGTLPPPTAGRVPASARRRWSGRRSRSAAG